MQSYKKIRLKRVRDNQTETHYRSFASIFFIDLSLLSELSDHFLGKSRMNLVIDFGNTTGKVALFDGDQLIKLIRPVGLEDISAIESEFSPAYCIISSTGISPLSIKEKVQIESIVLTPKVQLPFQIAYATPDTLGLDRIAATAGANFQYPNENCLIVDMGTCITYDLLIDNCYKGGGISPGLDMRFKALSNFTANLPLVGIEEETPLVGDSTKGSILSGVVNGLAAELDGIISKYCDKFGPLRVLICGGDYIFFENRLKGSIFAAPELVLQGLNGILRYNVS